jgi:predicted DNA-binding transcriptional regulator AlpA
MSTSLETKEDFVIGWLARRSELLAPRLTPAARPVRLRLGLITKTSDRLWWEQDDLAMFAGWGRRRPGFRPEVAGEVLQRTDDLHDTIEQRQTIVIESAREKVRKTAKNRDALYDRSRSVLLEAFMAAGERHPNAVSLITEGDFPDDVRLGVRVLAGDPSTAAEGIIDDLSSRLKREDSEVNDVEDLADATLNATIDVQRPDGISAAERPTSEQVRAQARKYLAEARRRHEPVSNVLTLAEHIATTLWYPNGKTPLAERVDVLFDKVMDPRRLSSRLRSRGWPPSDVEELIDEAGEQASRRIGRLVRSLDYGQRELPDDDVLLAEIGIRVERCLRGAQARLAEQRSREQGPAVSSPLVDLANSRASRFEGARDLLVGFVAADRKAAKLSAPVRGVLLDWARHPVSEDGCFVGLDVLEDEFYLLSEEQHGGDWPAEFDAALDIAKGAIRRLGKSTGSVSDIEDGK